jgi:hypothetical protein
LKTNKTATNVRRNVSKLIKLKTGTWDLSELIKNPKDDEFSSFLSSIDAKVKQFEDK